MVGDVLPDEWEWTTLGEVADPGSRSIVSGPFGSNIGSRFFVDTGVPVIRGSNLTTDMTRFVDAGFVFVTENKAAELANCQAIASDLVFTAAGTLGQVGLIPTTSAHPRYIISNKQLRARLDPRRVNPLFAFYWFASPEMVRYVQQQNTGSTIPLINLTVLRSLPLPLPPLREQEAIASILGALDDKIELNRRMSETLEAMARALFKAWFVDQVEIPSNADPGDWEVKALDEIADFLNGAACQRFPVVDGEASLPVVKIRELNQGITKQSDRVAMSIPAKWHVADGDVLFSWSGTLLARIWVGGPAALNQHLFKVTSSTYPKWFIYRWVLHHLGTFRGVAADKATTMGHIKRHHLSDAVCIVPPPETLGAMSGVMTPLLDRQFACDLESSTLGALRDTLLPKLISGELRVPDAERLVSEVA